jgi:hypothetical protein
MNESTTVAASLPDAFDGKKLRSPRWRPPRTMASVTHHVPCDSTATITSTSPFPVDSTAWPDRMRWSMRIWSR